MKLEIAEAAKEAPPVTDLSPSVLKILSGALDAIAARGVKRLSMSDIIETSGVSRGTLYRYFSNKDEVLAAVGDYVCGGFETGVREAGEQIEDPVLRLRAVMEFYSRYTLENTPLHVFKVEPGFHIDFFRSHFDRYKTVLAQALELSYDHFEQRIGQPLDRDTIVETLIRLQLSTILVPASPGWTKIWNESAGRFEHWLRDLAIRSHDIMQGD